MKICEYCKGEFTPAKYQYTQLFCSRKCADNHKKLNGRPERVCAYCDRIFKPKSSERLMFCSRECAFASKNKTRLIRQAEQVAKREANWPHCLVCGNRCQTSRAVLCSKECRKVHARNQWITAVRKAYIPQKRACKGCGKSFETEYGHSHALYCSKECARRTLRRVGKSIRRARKRQLQYERIDPIMIFHRDGWKCQLCGVKTPKQARGTIESNAPELDHIIPLSQGGAHTEANVQCACRKCNADKGQRIMGQSRLF